MKRFIIAVVALVLAVSCATERTPEEKVMQLLTEHFDSLALDCKVVSVALKDTLRAKLTTEDPGYKELCDKWTALMDARVDPWAPEYKAARQAMADYEAAWVGEPIAYEYSCRIASVICLALGSAYLSRFISVAVSIEPVVTFIIMLVYDCIWIKLVDHLHVLVKLLS